MLQNQTILITGGVGAIGRVIVKRLADHGAFLAVNDIVGPAEAARILRACGVRAGRVRYLRADITDARAAQGLVRRAAEWRRRLDACLCHAGRVEPAPFLEVTEEAWDRQMDLNVKAAFLVGQAAARRMVADGTRGKILFTTSWVQDVPWPEITPYHVSKSGMKTLMRGMARELAPYGIRVNAVAPGIVGVGMAKRQWDTDPSYQKRAKRAIPLGFMQPPESVADAMLFLCSSLSDYMTGSVLLVDGGCSLYPMD
ncbi:MAG: SDR family oxidoreductase [Planctomycetes bacterium]|nr:SDR family oxidoreductase [Planctomycetota bacterium]